jgi:hypothetical protein
MRDIPEAEARALLTEQLRCEDAPDWMPLRIQPHTFEIGVGVVDLAGKSVGMYVQLHYRFSLKTKIIKYQFSVFLRQPYGLERVYQLQVNHFPVPVRDAHQRSHEHIGNLRVIGSANWENWRYDDVITYFCKQTNIAFVPDLPHPEHFQLKG